MQEFTLKNQLDYHHSRLYPVLFSPNNKPKKLSFLHDNLEYFDDSVKLFVKAKRIFQNNFGESIFLKSIYKFLFPEKYSMKVFYRSNSNIEENRKFSEYIKILLSIICSKIKNMKDLDILLVYLFKFYQINFYETEYLFLFCFLCNDNSLRWKLISNIDDNIVKNFDEMIQCFVFNDKSIFLKNEKISKLLAKNSELKQKLEIEYENIKKIIYEKNMMDNEITCEKDELLNHFVDYSENALY